MIFFITLIFSFLFITPSYGNEPRVTKPEIIEASLLLTGWSAQKTSRDTAVKITSPAGSHGSGTYLKYNDHHIIVTAKHVVATSDIQYISTDQEVLVGQVIWRSKHKDIAVIKIPKFVSISPATLPNKLSGLAVGDIVYYTGFPANYEALTIKANVSGFATKRFKATILQGFVWFGSSGAGLFDEEGVFRGVAIAVGVEEFYGHPQVLETIVYSHELSRQDLDIIHSLLP